MNYSLLVFDLDGTLTDGEGRVTPASLSALERLMDAGVQVVLASGRPTFGIKPVADALKLSARGGYILAFNGGLITECRTGDVIHSATLHLDVVPTLAAFARRAGVQILTYDGAEILCENPDDEFVQREVAINKMQTRRVACFEEAVGAAPQKCLIAGDPAVLVGLEAEMAAALEGQMEVYRSAPYFLELVPRGIDKAKSLQRLLAKLRLGPHDMMAFGDGYNDLSMIRLAGVGVAMGNAMPEVRAEADFVTRANTDEGIAFALRHFFPELLS